MTVGREGLVVPDGAMITQNSKKFRTTNKTSITTVWLKSDGIIWDFLIREGQIIDIFKTPSTISLYSNMTSQEFTNTNIRAHAKPFEC